MTDLGGLSTALSAGLGQAVGGLGQTVAGVGQAALGAVEHVVQPGETVGSIASDHGVSVGSVMAANPQVLHPDIVEAGAHLTVPSPLQAETPAQAYSVAPSVAPAPSDSGPPEPLAPADIQGPTTSGSASPAASGGALPLDGDGVRLQAGGLLSPLAREAVDFRLQQQGRLGVAVATAPLEPLTAASPHLAASTLLQALASDPEAAAAFARLLGDGKAAVLAVLTARLASGPEAGAIAFASGAGADARLGVDASGRPAPAGVDLAARAAARDDRLRIAGGQHAAAPETAQAAWIRRCAPAAISAKARWGVPTGFTIAHGALASDWGRLAPGNDFFGLLPVSAPGAARALVALAGPAIMAFDSLDHAADAFGDRLRGDARYVAAFRAPHASAFAARVAAGGLMSDPLYAPAMEAVIEVHALARFD